MISSRQQNEYIYLLEIEIYNKSIASRIVLFKLLHNTWLSTNMQRLLVPRSSMSVRLKYFKGCTKNSWSIFFLKYKYYLKDGQKISKYNSRTSKHRTKLFSFICLILASNPANVILNDTFWTTNFSVFKLVRWQKIVIEIE